MNTRPARRHRLSRALLPLIAGGLALLLYVATAAPGLTWAHHGADGGDLMAAAMTGGVPHPSGYPTYCLLARAFAALPLGDIARRFNLFSAVCAAAAVAVAAAALRRALAAGDTPGAGAAWPAALMGALTWAAGATFWGQATIAEVYALAALFAALCLYLALCRDLLARPWGWALLGATLGAGLGAHLTLALLLPGLAVLLWPAWRAPRAPGPLRASLALLGGLMLGLGAFAYLPLAARGTSPVVWGEPRHWAGVWWVVSGRLYHTYLLGAPPAEMAARAWTLAGTVAGQFPAPAWLLAAYGLIDGWRRPATRRLAAASALIAATFGAYTLGYYTADAAVYLLPAHLMAALWAALGAARLGERLDKRPGRAGAAVQAALAAALLALPAVWAGLGWAKMDLRHDDAAIRWVGETLEALPHGAVLITSEDGHTFALAYAQWVEGERADVLAVDGDLWREPWYARQVLGRAEAVAVKEGAPLATLAAALSAERPVYVDAPRGDLPIERLRPAGPLWQLIPPQGTDADQPAAGQPAPLPGG